MTSVLGHWVPGVKTVGTIAALGIAAAVALRWPTGSPGGAVRGTALVLATTVLLSPVVHAWYALWCIPIVGACRLGPRGHAVFLWLSVALGVSAPLDSSLEGMPVHIAITTVAGGRHRGRVHLGGQAVRSASPPPAPGTRP